jgi:hypothetical protein
LSQEQLLFMAQKPPHPVLALALVKLRRRFLVEVFVVLFQRFWPEGEVWSD